MQLCKGAAEKCAHDTWTAQLENSGLVLTLQSFPRATTYFLRILGVSPS
jgi:hypothetical protein